MTKPNRVRLAIASLILLSVLSCSDTQPAPEPIGMFDGSTKQLSDFGSEIVVLNFWATWCAPCVKEMPELDRFWQENKERVSLIGVAVSTPELAVSGFIHRVGVQYPIALDDDGVLSRKYRVSILPTTVLVNADGEELLDHKGVITKDQLEEAVENIMERDPA